MLTYDELEQSVYSADAQGQAVLIAFKGRHYRVSLNGMTMRVAPTSSVDHRTGITLTPQHFFTMGLCHAVIHGYSPLHSPTIAAEPMRPAILSAEPELSDQELLNAYANHPAKSRWLIEAMQQAFRRDPIDALHDAQELVAVLTMRSDRTLKTAKKMLAELQRSQSQNVSPATL